jgi:hypothetical protein
MPKFVRAGILAAFVCVGTVWSNPSYAAHPVISFALEAAAIVGVTLVCDSKETRQPVVAWISAKTDEWVGLARWLFPSIPSTRLEEILRNSDELDLEIREHCNSRAATKSDVLALKVELKKDIADDLAKIIELREKILGKGGIAEKVERLSILIGGNRDGGNPNSGTITQNLPSGPPPRAVKPKYVRSRYPSVPCACKSPETETNEWLKAWRAGP